MEQPESAMNAVDNNGMYEHVGAPPVANVDGIQAGVNAPDAADDHNDADHERWANFLDLKDAIALLKSNTPASPNDAPIHANDGMGNRFEGTKTASSFRCLTWTIS